AELVRRHRSQRVGSLRNVLSAHRRADAGALEESARCTSAGRTAGESTDDRSRAPDDPRSVVRNDVRRLLAGDTRAESDRRLAREPLPEVAARDRLDHGLT